MTFDWFLNQATGDTSTAIPRDQQQRELTEGKSESQGDGHHTTARGRRQGISHQNSSCWSLLETWYEIKQ